MGQYDRLELYYSCLALKNMFFLSEITVTHYFLTKTKSEAEISVLQEQKSIIVIIYLQRLNLPCSSRHNDVSLVSKTPEIGISHHEAFPERF